MILDFEVLDLLNAKYLNDKVVGSNRVKQRSTFPVILSFISVQQVCI